jgi:predicted GTPase
MTEEKTITLKEAIAQGYKFCGDNGQEDLDFIKDISEEDLIERINSGEEIFVSEKECIINMPDADDVMEHISESICEEVCECGVEEVYNIVNKHKDKIQKLLNEIFDELYKEQATATYEATNIKLVPEIKNNVSV